MAPQNNRTSTFESRSIFWWLLCGPGAALLWYQYYDPRSVVQAISTRRAKDKIFFQFLVTLTIYMFVAFILITL